MTLLSLSKVEKHYPGVKALDGVDFQLREGEIHALLGENGAGKSTLVKVMTGALAGDGGSMTYLDKPLKLKSTAHAQTVGISTVYQEVNLLPNLTVAQNIYLGREPKKFGLIDWQRINRQSREVLKRFDLDIVEVLEGRDVCVRPVPGATGTGKIRRLQIARNALGTGREQERQKDNPCGEEHSRSPAICASISQRRRVTS